MSRLARHLKARPRLLVALAIGLAVGFALPEAPRWTTRALVGWNAGVWVYLVLALSMMLRADHGRLRRVAYEQAQGAAVVLGVVVAAAVASLAAIVVELAAVKSASPAWPHLLLAATTVLGSWLLLPVMFALNYASLYCHNETSPGGLNFPGADAAFRPDFYDFLYFSVTIAVASQTADVSISTQPMRRLVLLQSVLSFAFNTAILALTINIAAGLF